MQGKLLEVYRRHKTWIVKHVPPSKYRIPTYPIHQRGCPGQQSRRRCRLSLAPRPHCYCDLLKTVRVAAENEAVDVLDGGRRHPTWGRHSSGRDLASRVPSANGHLSTRASRELCCAQRGCEDDSMWSWYNGGCLAASRDCERRFHFPAAVVFE